jgi:hypothetical protein
MVRASRGGTLKRLNATTRSARRVSDVLMTVLPLVFIYGRARRVSQLVDPAYRAPKKRAHFERLVEIEAVVGTDGRLHRPLIKTSLDPAHETAVLGVLPFSRFEPARRVDAPVGARISLELVFRVY